MNNLISTFQKWALLAPHECKFHNAESYRFLVKISYRSGYRDINGEYQPPSQLEFLLFTVINAACIRGWAVKIGADITGYYATVSYKVNHRVHTVRSSSSEHPARAALIAYVEFLESSASFS